MPVTTVLISLFTVEASGWMGALDSLVWCVVSFVQVQWDYQQGFFPEHRKDCVLCVCCSPSTNLSLCGYHRVYGKIADVFSFFSVWRGRWWWQRGQPRLQLHQGTDRLHRHSLVTPPCQLYSLPANRPGIAELVDRTGWPGVKHRPTNLLTYSFLPTIEHSTTLFTDQTFGTVTTSVPFLLQPFALQFFGSIHSQFTGTIHNGPYINMFHNSLCQSIPSSLAAFIMVYSLMFYYFVWLAKGLKPF